MSSQQILKLGEEFSELYTRANDILKSIKNKSIRKSDLENVQTIIASMSTVLDHIELELQMKGDDSTDNVERKIALSCRDKYNEIRKLFTTTEGYVKS